MKALLRRADRALLRLIYPEGVLCAACGRASHGERLCGVCAEELKRLEDAELMGTEGVTAVHVWRYAGAAAALVHQLKFDASGAAAAVLSEGMAARARGLQLPQDTLVTWVPMPRSRSRERWVDHARMLAEATARQIQLPCAGLLERTRDIRTQRGLDRAQRLENVKNGFAARTAIDHPVLLIDDVLTTGATAQACCEALTAAGAARVVVLTATRVLRDADKDGRSDDSDV